MTGGAGGKSEKWSCYTVLVGVSQRSQRISRQVSGQGKAYLER